MGLFNQKNNLEQESQKADKEAISSIIDANMVMKGELIFKGKARIDGNIEGNIKGEHLILSETGKVTGDIQVSTFICHGTLEGNAKASLITARKSCNIHGRLEGNSLTVEPGAKLNGEMKISSSELHLVNDKESQSNKLTKVAEG
jgi:cytoskeletal protein CcmA (bactofilin family)